MKVAEIDKEAEAQFITVQVPLGALADVHRVIRDYEIAQRIGTKSQYDELWDLAAANDPDPRPF